MYLYINKIYINLYINESLNKCIITRLHLTVVHVCFRVYSAVRLVDHTCSKRWTGWSRDTVTAACLSLS